MKNKKEKPIRVRYIDCICHDMEDLTRLIYEPEEKEFYFEYKLIRMPGKTEIQYREIKTIFDKIKYKIEDIRAYFHNIWYAIKGLPHWHMANATYKNKEAKKIAKFINDSIDGKDAGEVWGE